MTHMSTQLPTQQASMSQPKPPAKDPNLKQAKKFTLHNKQSIVKKNNFRLLIDQFLVNGENEETFKVILNELYGSGPEDTIELRIMSPGGMDTICQQLVNIVQNRFKDRNVAYIESHASSAGAILFLACDKRVIYWNSRFMYHNYKGKYLGKYADMRDRLDFDEKHLVKCIEVLDRKYFSDKEWKKIVNGKDHWMTSKEMLKRGIATHIIIEGVEYEAKEGLKKLKQYVKG